jgi:hypothetical protein
LTIFQVGKGFHKTDFYGVFPPPENPDIFTEKREHVHGVKKRYAATPYSLATMQQSTDRIEATERVLLGKLDDFAVGGGQRECDLGEWLHFFAFDVLGEVAFSKNFGFLEAGVDVDHAIRTIDQSQTYNGIVGQVPWWDHLLRRNPLWHLVPFLSTKNALVTRTALGQLEKRKNDEKMEYKDLLNSLIVAQKENPDKLSHGDVFAIAHGAIFAGSDSTASTMQSFCWNVLSNRNVYDKLVAEILDANLGEMVSFEEAQRDLPYFQACLKEAMRLQPAVGLNITRKVPVGGAEIDGKKIPGGTEVAVNGWVLHRETNVWGSDAEIFRPERWLGVDKERLREMDRSMFQVSVAPGFPEMIC